MINKPKATNAENDTALNRDDEMAALLPFYVSGRLDNHDHDRVAHWIETSPHARNALQNARDEQAQAITSNEAIPPPPHALRDAMEAIDREPQEFHQRFSMTNLIQGVIEHLNATPPALAWGAAAALLLVAIVETGLLLRVPIDAPYVVTAGSDTQKKGRTAIVRFTKNATMTEIADVLAQAGATIIEGPRGRDTFVVRFKEDGERAPIEERMQQLRRRTDLVRLLIDKKSSPQ